MLPLELSSSTPPGAAGGSGTSSSTSALASLPQASWDFGATPAVGLALRAEALVLSCCRLWCPPRPWSYVTSTSSRKVGGGGGAGDGANAVRGGFLHRVAAHTLACPANHSSGLRLLAALLPPETPTPLHRLVLPTAMATAAAAGVAVAAETAAAVDADTTGGDDDGDDGNEAQEESNGCGDANAAGGPASRDGIARLVGRVHTAAALERSEGLRRQTTVVLERRVGALRRSWDRCIAGDLFPPWQVDRDIKKRGSEGGTSGSASGENEGGKRWRFALAVHPLLAVTAPEVVNVPAVVASLCHSASPVLHERVLEVAKR